MSNQGGYDFSDTKRGPVVRVPNVKTRTTIRLDDGVLEWFREQVERPRGGSYQNLVNNALREHIRQADEPLDETSPRVVREELRLWPTRLCVTLGPYLEEPGGMSPEEG